MSWGPLALAQLIRVRFCEPSLQENLIGALLAIFGHLVVSIALNLQVCSHPQRCWCREAARAGLSGVGVSASSQWDVAYPIPGLGQHLVGCSRILSWFYPPSPLNYEDSALCYLEVSGGGWGALEPLLWMPCLTCAPPG